MGNIEVELKFPLHNFTEVFTKLSKEVSFKKVFQRDTYYVPPHRNFLEVTPISEWLRLRETDQGHSINYKKWHNETGRTTSCDEFETDVGSVIPLKALFKQLGFNIIVVVEKTRLSCTFRLVKIALDEVRDLGHFIELEATPKIPRFPDEEFLYMVLEHLEAEVGEQDFEGYPYKLLQKRGLILY